MQSVYFFSMLNHKALKAMAQSMEEATYRFGSILVDWGSQVEHIYLIRSGAVKMQRKRKKKPSDIPSIGKLLRESEAIQHSSEYWPDKYCDEICVREEKQAFGEEQLFPGLVSSVPYRAVVCSAEAVVARVPYSSIKLTLSTFDMFEPDVKDAISARFSALHRLREAIDQTIEPLKEIRLKSSKADDKMSERILAPPKTHQKAVSLLTR